MSIENPSASYIKFFTKHVAIARIVWRTAAVRRAIKRDTETRIYINQTLKTVTNSEFDGLEMFNIIASTRAAAGKATRRLTVA